VNITFWHSESASANDNLVKLVDRFNASQDEVKVEAVYQGSDQDLALKLIASMPSGNVPTIAYQSETYTQAMIDSGQIVPIQQYIDRDKYDLSDFSPAAIAYFTVNGTLYAMPHGLAVPLMYYNKIPFREVGLDPEQPPRDLDEARAASEKLVQHDSAGNVTRYGFAQDIHPWYVELTVAVSGGLYVDNGNGRDALATKAVFNSPEGVRILEWWKSMYDEGILGNYGRATSETRNAFSAQNTAMIIESTATLRGLLDASKDKFELGTGFLPRPNEEAFKTSGTIIGGASLWILKDRPPAEQQCAWELVKHLVSPKMQAFWHINSGYYPIHKRGYDEPMDKEWRAKYPQFQTAIDQLHMAPNTRVTQGALTGVMPQARQAIEAAIEAVLLGKATPKEALDKAAADVTKAIEDYNKTTARK
jgi:sn-glycerol 3-phosphate transport system substrate-binding protein